MDHDASPVTCLKSSPLRVTSSRPCTKAVAAMTVSASPILHSCRSAIAPKAEVSGLAAITNMADKEILIFFSTAFIQRVAQDFRQFVCHGRLVGGGSEKSPGSLLLAKEAAERETRLMLAERMARLGIRAADLVETFTCSSGPGGQNVNKVSSRVTIRHVPTGISVTASDSRSQSQNRQLALERLVEFFETQRAEKRQERQAEASKARRQKAKRSRSTKRKLVEGKRHRGETKKMRGKVL